MVRNPIVQIMDVGRESIKIYCLWTDEFPFTVLRYNDYIRYEPRQAVWYECRRYGTALKYLLSLQWHILLSQNFKNTISHLLVPLLYSVSDPEPDWIRIQSGQWIRIQSGQWIRIQEGKNDPHK